MSLLLLCLLVLPARSAGLEEAVGLDELQAAAGAYLDGYLDVEDLTGEDLSGGTATLLKAGASRLPGLLREAMGSGILLLGTALLCGLAGAVREGLGGAGLDPVRLAGAAAVAAIAVGDVNALLELGRQTLGRMDDFAKLLLPTVTAAAALTGSPAAAAARQGAALLFYSLLLTLTDQLLLPLVYAYVAAVTASSALENEGLKRVAKLLKWAATGLLSLLLTGFVGWLTLTGAVAGNSDALAQKAAKTALSGMVPVVGGILSDAAETVVAGAGILRGTVGVVGVLVTLWVCLVPFLRLGLHYLVYRGAAALAAVAAPGPAASLIDDVGAAFALILGMVAGGGLILFVALVTSVKAVSGG